MIVCIYHFISPNKFNFARIESAHREKCMSKRLYFMEYFYFWSSGISISASNIPSGVICRSITPTITTMFFQEPAEKCNFSPIKTSSLMLSK